MKGLFVYGALLSSHGIGCDHAAAIILPGYIRRFCISSVYGRGTPELPGLVCGIESASGGEVAGKLLYNDDGCIDFGHAVVEKELRSGNYNFECVGRVLVGDVLIEQTYALVANVHSSAYVQLPLNEQAYRIQSATGTRGSALEYFRTICDFVDSLELRDTGLEALRRVIE